MRSNQAILWARIHSEKKMGMKDRRIVAAAIQRDGIVFTGVRHGYIIQQMVDVGFLKDIKKPVTYDEQGFIDNNNKFIKRDDATAVAVASGQVKPDHGTLYSEDLW